MNKVPARALKNRWNQPFSNSRARAETLRIIKKNCFIKPVLGRLIWDKFYLYQKMTDFNIGVYLLTSHSPDALDLFLIFNF